MAKQKSLMLMVISALMVLEAAGHNSSSPIKSTPNWQPRFLGQTPLKHPAFMEMYLSENDLLQYEDRWTLFISTFDPEDFGEFDAVFKMNSPGKFLDDISAWNIQLMDESSYWPNNPDYMPSSVCGNEGVIWSSGFLLPGKMDGQLQLYDTTLDPPEGPFNIASTDEIMWSYHHVVWKDMDVDGDLDALTCRFHQPVIGPQQKELMWLENEGQGLSEGWKQHVIASDGPDISFALVTLSAGGRQYECILASEYFNFRTSIFWTESLNNDWSDLSQVHSRVIVENAGQPFDLLVDDFNRDGSLEFMQTEFDTDLGIGHVSIYFFPNDFRTDDFEGVRVADGFVPNEMPGGSPTMSPGTPKSYYPSVQYQTEMAEDGRPHKPWVLVSGDDDGRVYILLPDSDDRQDWNYQKLILTDTGSTTAGKMTHGDLDGDGYTEVVVAGYTVGLVYVYTYAP